MLVLFSILTACGGGGGSSGEQFIDPNPSLTSFSVSPGTIDFRGSVTFEWQINNPTRDMRVELTGYGDVTGRSSLTAEDVRFGGLYRLNVSTGSGFETEKQVDLRVRPESIPQGFVGLVNDNLLVWHGWKLDHEHSYRARFDYIRLLFEHQVVPDVFDWIAFVETSGHYLYAGSFSRVSDQGERGFSTRGYANDRYYAERLRTSRLRGVLHFAYPGAVDHALSHEIMHQWANGIRELGVDHAHWGYSDVHGRLGGFDRDTLRVFDAEQEHHAARAFSDRGGSESSHLTYSPLEMYLAGWGPLSDVPPIRIAHGADWVRDLSGTSVEIGGGAAALVKTSNEMGYEEYIFHAPDGFTTYDRDWLLDMLGPRERPLGEAETNFRLLFVFMVDKAYPANIDSLEGFSDNIARMTRRADAEDGEEVTFWQAAARHGPPSAPTASRTCSTRPSSRGSIPWCATSGATPICARGCGPASDWSLMCPTQ